MNALFAFKGSTLLFLFVIPAAGVVPRGGCKKVSPQSMFCENKRKNHNVSSEIYHLHSVLLHWHVS